MEEDRMILTKKWIDQHAPKHGRTSCDDDHLNNHYGGWDGTYRRENGKKDIRIPGCTRCYLLFNVGMNTEDIEFEPVVEVWLKYKEAQ
jgi:hypothetical protein